MDTGKLVTIFGGGGFVGRALAQALFARGWRVRIAQRHPERAYAVKALGSLGQCQFVVADVTKADSVARAITGSDAVVNLTGTFGSTMAAVHAGGAGTIARAAAAAGIPVFVHMSAIGADPESPAQYGRTKAAGEAAVRAAFPAATIIRPSIIFGRDDQFTNRFAQLIGMLPVVPVIAGETRFQPVFVGDVANAIAEAVVHADVHGGKTFELGGPDTLSMAELFRWLASETGRHPDFMPVPDGAARLLATLTGWAPGAPITSDQFAMLSRDNVAAPGAPGLADLGVDPTPMAAVAPTWLTVYRKHGRFGARASA